MKHDKPSATAALVLKALLFASRDPLHGKLVSVDAARWSEAIAAGVLRFPRLFARAVDNPLSRRFFKKAETMLNPGFILHVAARKALIGRLGAAAMDAGVSQIIVVGAGYDTFALRMATLHPHAHCYEVDHPSTQTAKRAALADAAPAANLYFVPADLSVRSLADVLAAHPRFDASRKTLVVIEGVLMYLPVAAVTNFFGELAALFQNGLTCIFTFMDRRANGDIQFKTAHPAVNWWLQRKRERFLWGIERTRIADFLIDAGFTNSVSYGKADFERILFAGESPLLAEGELIGVATR